MIVALRSNLEAGYLSMALFARNFLGEVRHAMTNQDGFIKTVMAVLLGAIIIGTALPVLWPLMVGTDTDVQAMTETDDATVTLQAFYPVFLIVVGLAIAAGLIWYALRKFGILS